MSRPAGVAASATGPSDRVVVSNSRGHTRIIGDPFAPTGPVSQLNTYGHSVTAQGRTSGALLSRQQQESLQSRDAANMLLDALEKYGPAPGAKKMLDWERDAARHAVSSGVYVSWRSPKGQDCTRVGPESLCFCGHEYSSHGGPTGAGWKKNRHSCNHSNCTCVNYSFIPKRPEEAGEWWLVRRKDFDIRTYQAKCKCKHAHTEHDPKGMHSCRVK